MRILRQLIAKLTRTSATLHPLSIPDFNDEVSMEVHSGQDIHISKTIAETGIWEAAETRFVLEALNEGDTFVDVGANIGYFTLLASKKVGPNGQVIAFEPDAENYRLLARNCQQNRCDNVQLHHSALGRETASGELFLSETNMGDHTIYPADGERKSTAISIVQGSDILPPGQSTIDFLKVDTQGSEYQVLEGLAATLPQSLPGLKMMIEFSPISMAKTGRQGLDFLELLAPLNGFFYLLDNQQSGIIPISMEHLRAWTRLTEMTPESEGFINLVFSGSALEEQDQFTITTKLGLFDNALEYLVGKDLPAWNGSARSAREMSQELYFASGWSFFEDWGVWSNGRVSRLKFYVDPSMKELQNPKLLIQCRYFGDIEDTELTINNIPVGSFDLSNATIPLPGHCLRATHITMEFKHRYPRRPSELENSEDNRELKLGIEHIAIAT